MIPNEQILIHAESDSHYGKASEYYHKAESEKAMDQYSQGIEADPYHSKAMYYKEEILNRLVRRNMSRNLLKGQLHSRLGDNYV